MLAQQDVSPDRIRRLTRVEYDTLVESGLLQDCRVELLLGAMIDMSPQGPLHAETVRRLAERFIRALPTDVHTRVQSPLALTADSEPEPDLAVVAAGDYRTGHPTQALLVVEVAETSLRKDRGIKTGLYATAGVPEFWLVNLPEQIVEVHRLPDTGRYSEIVRIGMSGVVESDQFPTLRIAAADLLG